MKLTCNIDQHGRRYRTIGGWILTLLALAVGLAAWVRTAWELYFIAGGMLMGGMFMLFEAHHSWCAIRAVKVKIRVKRV